MTTALIEREPVTLKLTKTVVKCLKGDLTALPVDAFVYYAREDLQLGSGYGTAIQQRGGSSIQKELAEFGALLMGDAVVTGAGTLPAKHIIHVCGPKFHEPDLERKLRAAMWSALRAGAQAGARTIAFPPMGYGFYGVPMKTAATVMLDVIRSFATEDDAFEEIIICLADARDFDEFAGLMAA